MGKGAASSESVAEQDTEKHPVNAGDIIAGKFRVERIIGEGGMGVVVEATHLQLEERVALKFLRTSAMSLPDVVSRFAQEARAAVRLKSEHVARIIDVGSRDDGTPFMVMEYLEGADLGHVLEREGPLRISDAVEYMIQACEGVGEAHARGIVHRDIKPENLFLVSRDDGWKLVKVLDFGISKAALTGKSAELLGHETKSLMGSPFYMSPEQLRSTRTVDHRADIWSLGVVLFELLTGTVPFDPDRNFTELVADILETPHRRLRLFRPDAPVELENIVDRCLEKDRSLRFQNCAELAIAMLPFAPRRSRVTAERTTSFTRAAGLLTDPTLEVPPSIMPPSFSAPPDEQRASMIARASSPTEPAFSAVSSRPPRKSGTPAPSALAVEERRKPFSLLIFLGAALVLGLVGVGALYARSTSSKVASPSPDATTAAKPTDTGPTTLPTPSSAPNATTTPALASAGHEDTGALSAAVASTKPGAAAHPRAVVVSAHTPSASATVRPGSTGTAGSPSVGASPARPDGLEIRRER